MSEALYEHAFHDDTASDGELDVHGLGRAIARRKWLVIIPTLAVFLAAAIYVNIVTPRYTGEAQVLVENQENYFTRPDNAPAGVDPAPDAEAVTSQVQLVTSRDLARDAIKALGLRGLPEFDPAAGGVGPLGRVLILLGLRRAPTDLSVEDRILEIYYNQLSVSEVAKSRVLEIDFSSEDPELAAKAANTIAALYIGLQADAKRSSARLAADSLGAQIADLRAKVADAENQATSFRASANLLVGNNNTTVSSQQLADMTSQLTMARAAEADAQAKAHLIRDMLRQGRINDIPDVANNELIRQISAQRINLRAQLALESRTYLPGHPRIKELNAQLGDLESNLRAAAEQTARTLENDAQIAGTRLTNLQAAIDQQKKKVGDSSSDAVKMQELDGDAQVLRTQLDAATTKYQEALARENADSTPGDARVISRAIAPILPTFPKKLPLMIFATLAALVLSVAYVLSCELLSGRAFVVAETVPQTQATAPAAAFEAAPYELRATEPQFAPAVEARAGVSDGGTAAIEDVLARLGADAPGDYATRILVAGTPHRTSGLAMAVSLARTLTDDRRVVLVELEAVGAGGTSPPGLFELIAGQASFAEVIHRDRGSRLHSITAGRRSVDASEGLDLALEALSQTYDYVVLATPPVDTALVRALVPGADFIVLACIGDAADLAMRDALVRSGAGEVFLVAAEAVPTAREDTKAA